MKFLIVRTYPSEMNIETYNVQEIGLAKAIIRKGYDCDVALFTKSNSHMDRRKSAKNILDSWQKICRTRNL